MRWNSNHIFETLSFSQMVGILMRCLNTMRRHTVWSPPMTAACPRTRKSSHLCCKSPLMSMSIWINTRNVLYPKLSFFLLFPGFLWSETALRSSLSGRLVHHSWRRRSKPVPPTRPAWLWKMTTALRKRNTLLWFVERGSFTASTGESDFIADLKFYLNVSLVSSFWVSCISPFR